MKKLTFLLCMLCLLLIVTVAACTSKPDGEDTSSETTAKITDEVTSEPSNETAEGQTTAETEPLETEEETTGKPELVSVIEGNVRVVLYSPSLCGSRKPRTVTLRIAPPSRSQDGTALQEYLPSR